MATKVLVFESDAAFAGELRNELGKLGCNTQVVDDGNVGLQQAASEKPDLILLSIELPRMNGFSVCNKLKKDPALKDVPLIIMSSESSEETFEQHRKLRTRAEDYVHKPIAFGELLTHINAFVRLGGSIRPSQMPPSEAGIVIEDEVAVNSQDYVEDDSAMTQIARRPDFPKPSTRPLPATALAAQPLNTNPDEDMSKFADDAFDALTGSAGKQNGTPAPAQAQAAPAAEPSPAREASSPSIKRQPSIPPRAGVDPAELERARTELEKTKARAADLEKELATAKSEQQRLQSDLERGSKSDADSQRMQREIDELKAKLASGAKSGGISSREFLDLREALNKKDKEILALKEGLTKKDKEIFENQDKSLALERSKADLEDKVTATESALEAAKEKVEALQKDKDLAKKTSEDFKARFEKTKTELDGKAKEIADLKAKHGEELAAAEAARAAIKHDMDQAIAREREEAKTRHEQALASHKSDLDELQRDRDARLAEAKELSDREKAEAVASRESAMKAETDSKLAALHRAHQQELDKARKEAAAALEDEKNRAAADAAGAQAKAAVALEDAQRAAAERLSAREAELEREKENRLAAQAQEHADTVARFERERDAHVEMLGREHAEKIASVENDRDARVAALEAKAARELGDLRASSEAQKAASDERTAKLEMDLSGIRGELQTITEAKQAGDAANEARIADLTAQLSQMTDARHAADRDLASARDRVAVLEAELTSTKQDLSETRTRLDNETSRAQKAYSKWESDRASLERAKDALAVALAQIEDAEGRSIS